MKKLSLRGLFCGFLALAMMVSLCGAAFASDEASAEAASDTASGEVSDASDETSSAASSEVTQTIEAWPSFKSSVCTVQDGDSAAGFLCYGVFDENGDIVPFPSDTIAVTLYDAEIDGDVAAEVQAVYDGEEGAWAFEIPLPEENTVYWASFDGSLVAPVYVVVDEAETTQELYNEALDISLPLSSYAGVEGAIASDDSLYADPYSGLDITRSHVGTNSSLFTLDDFQDLADASEEELAAVSWWINSGFTNGGDSLYTFGYDRPAFYTFELTMFIYRYFGISDNAYVVLLDGFEPGTDPYFDSILNTAGTGIIDDISAVVPGESIDCGAHMTYEDILATLYNAMKSSYSKLSEDGLAAAGELPEADSAADKAAAMADLLGTDVEDYGAEISKMEAIEIFYALAQNSWITNMTYPDEDYALATSLDVEGTENPDNGNDRTQEYEINMEITEDCTLEGEDAVFVSVGDEDAVVISGGAQVTLIDPYLTNASTNNSYPFGGGAVLLARDAGTVVRLIGTDGSMNMDVEGTSMAGGLFPLCSATIYCENFHIFSARTHTSNLTYNGILWYSGSTILGYGRIYSTDFWGGYIVFDNTVSFKQQGSGASVTDESSMIYYKNSYIHGSSYSEINGCGSIYFENCVADFDAYYEFHNNTSYWCDTGSLTAVNTELNFGENFYWANKGSKSVVTLVDSSLTLNDDSEYVILLGYSAGGSDPMTGTTSETGAETEDHIVHSLTGDAAEMVNGFSILRLAGDSTITGGAQKLFIGELYSLAIETDDAFEASGNVVEFTIDRTEDGNTGDLYVNGELVEGSGVHDFGGVVINVIE